MAMTGFRNRLSTKIIGILVLYFVVAFMAIGMTLHVSTQFEGSAAAINDAGSERMGTYRLAYLVTQPGRDAADRAAYAAEAQKEIARFEKVLGELEQGNPSRPLFLPREVEVTRQMVELRQSWQAEVKPMIMRALALQQAVRLEALPADFGVLIERFVGRVNDLVVRVELSNSRITALLRSLQIGLVVLALVGTVILILWFHLMVLRPVSRLREGIQRMAAADFSVRVPVEQRDELGELADGFNRMTAQLEELYGRLELKVDEKTRSLADKNSELAMLYEVAAFLNEAASIEDLCRGFLRRVMAHTGVTGGTVRLVDHELREIRLVIHEGVSPAFAASEKTLCFGDCLCGEVAESGAPLTCDLAQPTTRPLRPECRAEGFRTVAVFTIHHQKQLVGIFTLACDRPREFSEREIRLLETLGQHLGLAIDNLRLVSREKDMAVSEERNVLAQELHDSIAQSLAFLNIQAQMLDAALRRGDAADARDGLAQMREGIQESYDHVRELLVHFRTRMPQTGLAETLRSALEKFEGQTGVATRFAETGAAIALAPEIELQVLHIVQEALSNVRKHSRAKRVSVEIRHGKDEHVVIVRDDGIGFDAIAGGSGDEHMGVQIMRERAWRIGGQLELRSANGDGTEVRLRLPVPMAGLGSEVAA